MVAIALVMVFSVGAYLVSQPADTVIESGSPNAPAEKEPSLPAVIIGSATLTTLIDMESEPTHSNTANFSAQPSPNEDVIDLGPDIDADSPVTYKSDPGAKVVDLGPDIDPEPLGSYKHSPEGVIVRDIGEDIDPDDFIYTSSSDATQDIGEDIDPNGYAGHLTEVSSEVRDIGEDIDAD